jgi:hypothetical protein
LVWISPSTFFTLTERMSGVELFSKRISRGKLLDFFAAQPSCTVALEACGGAHHWVRQLTQLGHEVRLIPPAYVKPFVKRNYGDSALNLPWYSAVPSSDGCVLNSRGGLRFANSPRGLMRFVSSDRMRQKPNFINQIKLIWVVQSPRKKYSASHSTQITGLSPAVLFRQEGRSRVVTNVGQDAVDARASVRQGDRRAG